MYVCLYVCMHACTILCGESLSKMPRDFFHLLLQARHARQAVPTRNDTDDIVRRSRARSKRLCNNGSDEQQVISHTSHERTALHVTAPYDSVARMCKQRCEMVS